jgi:hypothetical protein
MLDCAHWSASLPSPSSTALAVDAAPAAPEVELHRLLVFAVDEYGMLSRDAEKLLRECIVAQEDRLDVEGRLFTWFCRTFS